MADQDRSLRDIIKFVDSTNSIDDADISQLTQQLKFSDVLDLVSAIKANDTDSAKNILVKYDDRFAVSAPAVEPQQEASIPTIKPVGSTTTTTGQSAFPKIAPKGNLPSTANATQQGDEEDLDAIVQDPANKNRPEVKQIQNLLQRMRK